MFDFQSSQKWYMYNLTLCFGGFALALCPFPPPNSFSVLSLPVFMAAFQETDKSVFALKMTLLWNIHLSTWASEGNIALYVEL